MGYDYALVYVSPTSRKYAASNPDHRHLQYTIPPAVVLTLLYRPLCTSLDIYKILFLGVVRALEEPGSKGHSQ